MNLDPGTKLGPYEILAPIGTGGMGEVYRARDTRLGREVAIKISAERFSERFTREARATAALNHPNICHLYDVGPDYLVMELIEGENLKGPLALETALQYALQIVDALDAAHEKGIVHRDLKPGNIKITRDGVVKLLDFGLATSGVKEPEGDPEHSPTISMEATKAGVILGTAAYMAPEQARGGRVDKRADIWAFGVVLYEMLTGQRLFQGGTISDTLASVLKDKPPLHQVPAAVQRVLQACLQKDPKRRLRDISDARLLLEEGSAPVPPARRNVAPWLLAVACAVALWAPWRAAPREPGMVRFQIAPTVTLPQNGSSFAVSPDGRHLAFTGIGQDGVTRLWVRDFDSMQDRPVSGPESGGTPALPFWSHDSRFVAFATAEGKLRKVDISGSSVQTLCDVGGIAIGGSWNSEGVILIGNSSGPLLRVPADGGAPSPVTALRASPKETLHFFPVFLPDQRHFLYVRGGGKADESGLYVGSLDVKPEQQSLKKLMPFTGASVIHAPGRLLFRRGNSLFAQGFNDKTFELTGEPASIVPDVGSYLAYGFYSTSQNGVLVYRPPGVKEFQLTWFDHGGAVVSKVGPPGRYIGLVLSPDGRRAAVSLAHPPISWDLWMVDLARGTASRFTFESVRPDHPIWSADGKWVAYTQVGGGGGDLYRKMANGVGGEEVLLKSVGPRIPTSWSPDGRFLLSTYTEPQTGSDVWVVPLDGGAKAIRILGSAFNESEAQFSPDMHWIAYTSDESGRNEVYIRGFSASAPGATEIERHPVSNGGGGAPKWTGNGKELVYIAPDNKMMSVEITPGPSFQVSIPRPLFQLPPGTGAADVTADGKRFLFAIPVGPPAATPFNVVLNWTGGAVRE